MYKVENKGERKEDVEKLYEIGGSHGDEMSMLVFWVVTPCSLVG
jgi:hypothetical protein